MSILWVWIFFLAHTQGLHTQVQRVNIFSLRAAAVVLTSTVYLLGQYTLSFSYVVVH